MSDDASRYLQQYERSRADATENRRLGGIAGVLRRRLDAQAAALGQSDRHALFLPRVLQLCGIADEGSLTVMELGAGDGWALHYARPQLTRIAVDAGSNFAGRFAEMGIDFFERDVGIAELPADDDSVDVVMINHLIEHLADPTHMIAQCRRVLRPGGALYLRTPDITRVGPRFYDDYTHIHPYTPTSLQQLCTAYGFSHLFTFASDHSRINLDLLTHGRLRRWLFGRRFGGGEIEAAFRK